MALVHVVDANGNESHVGEAWLVRWPDDFTRVSELRPVPVKAATAAPIPPTGDKKKEK